MLEISLDYWNKLASQMLLISSLMSGFSIAVVVTLMVNESKNRFVIYTQSMATIAAGCFLISIFGWTDVMLMTTEGYPIKITGEDLKFSRISGSISLLFGVISLSLVLALSGWIRSKKVGIFTTIIGLLTFMMIILLSS